MVFTITVFVEEVWSAITVGISDPLIRIKEIVVVRVEISARSCSSLDNHPRPGAQVPPVRHPITVRIAGDVLTLLPVRDPIVVAVFVEVIRHSIMVKVNHISIARRCSFLIIGDAVACNRERHPTTSCHISYRHCRCQGSWGSDRCQRLPHPQWSL